MKTESKRMTCVCIILMLLLTGALGYMMFGHLGDVPLVDYDEARHGINAYEMIRNNDWIVHTYQGEPDMWNLKPPMSFWSIAACYGIFGFNALGLRFYSALAAMIASLAITAWMWKRRGGKMAVLTLLMIVANTSMMGHHAGRFADADAQYQMFFTLSMLFMLSSDKRFGMLYGSAVCFGLAFLTKGAHAACIPVVCLLYIICTGRIKELRPKRLLLLAASALAVILPWAVVRYLRDGSSFFTSMFGTDVAGRMGSVAKPEDADIPALQYYLTAAFRSTALQGCLVVSVLCVLAIVIAKQKWTREGSGAIIGAALWVAVPVILFTLTGARYNWYVSGTYYGMPMLAALTFAQWPDCTPNWRKVGIGLLCVMIAFFGYLGVRNVMSVSGLESRHTTQDFIKASIDRENDTIVHAYIQYAEDKTNWMPADMLTALLYGDLTCMDGGAEAFAQDEEPAMLFLTKSENAEEIEAFSWEYPLRNEDFYLVVFDN